jgi:hypothetical protein
MNSLQNSFKALLLLFVLVAGSCKHEPPAEPTVTCAYDCSLDEMKNYYFFKTGTQWIYEEETTHQVDTFNVYEHYEYPSGSFGFKVQTTLESCIFSYDHLEGMNYPCYTNPECIGRRVQLAKYDPLVGVRERELFVYPHIQSNYLNIICILGAGNYMTGKSVLEDANYHIENNGTVFTHVVQYHVETDHLYGCASTNYFFSRNYGLVRFENEATHENWDLKQYYIIQ